MPHAIPADPNFGRHFQGVSYNATNPGLKPWAILCSRFAANSRHFVPGRQRISPTTIENLSPFVIFVNILLPFVAPTIFDGDFVQFRF